MTAPPGKPGGFFVPIAGPRAVASLRGTTTTTGPRADAGARPGGPGGGGPQGQPIGVDWKSPGRTIGNLAQDQGPTGPPWGAAAPGPWRPGPWRGVFVSRMTNNGPQVRPPLSRPGSWRPWGGPWRPRPRPLGHPAPGPWRRPLGAPVAPRLTGVRAPVPFGYWGRNRAAPQPAHGP
jgi:hypothetical protein